MKCFTRNLYLRFNANDRTVVAEAHEEWETAIENYQQHLAQIRSRFNPNLRRLAKSLCLHDAAFLGVGCPKIPRLQHPIAVLATQTSSAVYLLVYMLAKEPRIQEYAGHWPFSKKNVHWLYDEFDVDTDGSLSHEILLSDGKSITLNFKDVQLIKDPWRRQAAMSRNRWPSHSGTPPLTKTRETSLPPPDTGTILRRRFRDRCRAARR